VDSVDSIPISVSSKRANRYTVPRLSGETIGARLEWVNYLDIEDEDVDTLNLGLYANF